MKNFQFPENLQNFRIHFVGIKGTGMTALVEICYSRGAVITGSDVPDVFYTDAILNKLSIPVFTSFDQKNITDDIQLVVYSSAYKRETNPELQQADALKLPVVLYSEALGAISSTSYACSIAGVHGKTTTTGMAGTVLKHLHLPAQILAGSLISSFNNSCTLTMGHKYFVAETCEYQRHFMAFCPQKILLTSVESDHQDYFPTYEDILQAFVDFAQLLPQQGQLVFCVDDQGAAQAAKLAAKKRPDIACIPYGEKAEGLYRLSFGKIEDDRQYFTLPALTKQEFALKVPGRHNVRNACGVIALCVELLKAEKGDFTAQDIAKIAEGLLDFSGAKRRSEIIGIAKGVLFMDDYGHHPTAVKTTLEGLREFYPHRRLIVDFMSHTYSRTAALLDEFSQSFGAADEVILHKIYGSAREQYDGTVTGQVLFETTKQHHPNVRYFEEVLQAQDFLASHLKKGDLFVTMGAGDNWKLGAALYSDFKKEAL